MTSVKAIIEMFDTTALGEATPESSDINTSYSSLALLKAESEYAGVGIMELNQFLLDGSKEIAGNTFKIPYISKNQSTANCTFSTTPKLKIKFASNHTSAGITLRFFENYPAEIVVKWYADTNATAQIEAGTFSINKLEFFCAKQVENYKAITLEFTKTEKPNQNIKLLFVAYGQRLVWSGEDVESASVDEECDVTSATVPINTAQITIVDEEEAFNIQNNDGLWKSLQAGQKMYVSEALDDEEIAIGTFYLDTWENRSNAVEFSLIDTLGIIDKSMFDGGMYSNITAGALIGQIMASAGVTDYVIDNDVKSIVLSGYLPIMSHREALQQVAFATSAVVDCSRSESITIAKPNRNVVSNIMIERKFSGATSVSLDEEVSGVSVTCKKYTLGEEETEIYNGHMEAGAHRIEFGRAYATLRIVGGTITKSNVNFVEFTCSRAGDVQIYGVEYVESEFTVSKSVKGDYENVKNFAGLSIYNAGLLNEVVNNLFDWFTLRQKVSIEYLCEKEVVSNWVAIQDSLNTQTFAVTRINRQSIDLTGGFIAKAECRGYSTITTGDSLMGTDLRMAQEEVI